MKIYKKIYCNKIEYAFGEFLEHHYRKTDYSFPNKLYVLRSWTMRSGSICRIQNKENNILSRVIQQISIVCLEHKYFIIFLQTTHFVLTDITDTE
jgi:hypothetical protein